MSPRGALPAARATAAPHRIGTIRAELTAPDDDSPLGAPERMVQALRLEILPALSDVLETGPLAQASARADSLTIDLGSWPADPDWHEVRRVFAARLEEALAPYLEPANDATAAAPPVLPQTQSQDGPASRVSTPQTSPGAGRKKSGETHVSDTGATDTHGEKEADALRSAGAGAEAASTIAPPPSAQKFEAASADASRSPATTWANQAGLERSATGPSRALHSETRPAPVSTYRLSVDALRMRETQQERALTAPTAETRRLAERIATLDPNALLMLVRAHLTAAPARRRHLEDALFTAALPGGDAAMTRFAPALQAQVKRLLGRDPTSRKTTATNETATARAFLAAQLEAEGTTAAGRDEITAALASGRPEVIERHLARILSGPMLLCDEAGPDMPQDARIAVLAAALSRIAVRAEAVAKPLGRTPPDRGPTGANQTADCEDLQHDPDRSDENAAQQAQLLDTRPPAGDKAPAGDLAALDLAPGLENDPGRLDRLRAIYRTRPGYLIALLSRLPTERAIRLLAFVRELPDFADLRKDWARDRDAALQRLVSAHAAQLRDLVTSLGPATAAFQSSVDHIAETSDNAAAALRVILAALFDGQPVDMETARAAGTTSTPGQARSGVAAPDNTAAPSVRGSAEPAIPGGVATPVGSHDDAFLSALTKAERQAFLAQSADPARRDTSGEIVRGQKQRDARRSMAAHGGIAPQPGEVEPRPGIPLPLFASSRSAPEDNATSIAMPADYGPLRKPGSPNHAGEAEHTAGNTGSDRLQTTRPARPSAREVTGLHDDVAQTPLHDATEAASSEGDGHGQVSTASEDEIRADPGPQPHRPDPPGAGGAPISIGKAAQRLPDLAWPQWRALLSGLGFPEELAGQVIFPPGDTVAGGPTSQSDIRTQDEAQEKTTDLPEPDVIRRLHLSPAEGTATGTMPRDEPPPMTPAMTQEILMTLVAEATTGRLSELRAALDLFWTALPLKFPADATTTFGATGEGAPSDPIAARNAPDHAATEVIPPDAGSSGDPTPDPEDATTAAVRSEKPNDPPADFDAHERPIIFAEAPENRRFPNARHEDEAGDPTPERTRDSHRNATRQGPAATRADAPPEATRHSPNPSDPRRAAPYPHAATPEAITAADTPPGDPRPTPPSPPHLIPLRDRIYWHVMLRLTTCDPTAPPDLSAVLDTALSLLAPEETDRQTLRRLVTARLGYAAGAFAADPNRKALHRALLDLNAGTAATPEPVRIAEATDVQGAALLVTDAAGLVIFHPFLPMLFDRMELLSPAKALRRSALSRALAALRGLSGLPPTPPADGLERVLLGQPIDLPWPDPADLGEKDEALIDGLMNSVIRSWSRLGKSTPDGLRDTFIRRTGTLKLDDTGAHLSVATGPFDMLLGGLPWPLSSPIALPWMVEPIFVTWKHADG